MKPTPGEWDSLRLAANAADRGKAAETLRPAFEKRLSQLGYSSRAVAHAFSALTGAHTVEEALAELEENARLERMEPVPLRFEVVEGDPALPAGHSLTITGVERDGRSARTADQALSRSDRRRPLASASPPRQSGKRDCRSALDSGHVDRAGATTTGPSSAWR
jgi:hypothetical protein